MVATINNTTKAGAVEHVLNMFAQRERERKVRVLKHAVRGQCLWYLAYNQSDERKWIGMVEFICNGRGQFKLLHKTECEGFGFYTCPVSWLKECSPPLTKYAVFWRAKLREHVSAQNEIRGRLKKMAVGTRISIEGRVYRLVYPMPHIKGWRAVSCLNGVLYSISRECLKKAQILEAE